MRQHSRHSFYASIWRYVDGQSWPATPVPAHPCHTTMFPGYRVRALRRPDRHAAGALALYADTHMHTCKTSLVTDSAFCYRPYAAPCFFFCWYPWIPGQVSVYVVGRVWHQPNFASAAPYRHAKARTAAVYYTMQRRHRSWALHAMPARGDFYYFVPTFLRQEFGSCVQKKGTTAMQVVAVESDIFKGITAIAVDAVCNFRAASQVTELVLLAWIFFVRVVGSQIFVKVTLSSRITSHLQSIFLKLIHFPLITHLSGQSHVIYKPRPIGDNILTSPGGLLKERFWLARRRFHSHLASGRPLRSNPA